MGLKSLYNLTLLLLYICIFVLISGCANVVPPSGGPKDTKPPVVIRAEPPQNSTKFTSNTIRLYFNKFVKLNNIYSNAIISPPTDKQPEYILKNKSLLIKLKSKLKDSTTYTLMLSNCIQDTRENNMATDLQYVFSTGNYLDSLMIKGTIIDAFSFKPEKDVLVMLYKDFNDSLPYKKTPMYVGRTNADGYFEIRNLKNIKYKIFALKDLNSNLLYDQPGEKIAFKDSIITPFQKDTAKPDTTKKNKQIHPEQSKKNMLNLLLFQESDNKQKIVKAFAVTRYQFQLIFKNPTDNIQLKLINYKTDFKKWYLKESNKTKDTLNFWIYNSVFDTIKCQVVDNNKVVDTIKINLGQKAKTKRQSKNEKLGYKLSANSNVSFDFYKPVSILFTNPVSEYDFKKISLIESKDTLKPYISFVDSNKRKLEISYKFKEGTEYKLFIKPKAFMDLYGLESDTIKTAFKTKTFKNYGTLTLIYDFSGNTTPKIIQLLDEKDNFIKEVKIGIKGKYVFPYMNPGKYKLRIFLDSNNNGKWDTGNYLKHIQPEKVSYYNKEIICRDNWDTEVEWKGNE